MKKYLSDFNAKSRKKQQKQTNENKTLLNSAAAVKQSNNAQEFQSAHWTIVRGRPSPHSYSTPPHNWNSLVVASLSHSLNAI